MIRELFRKIFHREERVNSYSSIVSSFEPLNPFKSIEEDIKKFSISVLYGDSRVVNSIVIHCSETREDEITDIDSAESFFKSKGYNKSIYTGMHIPYHYLIEKNGKICKLTPLNAPSLAEKNSRNNSISICYIGGIDEFGIRRDTRTFEQKRAIKQLISTLSNNLGISNILWNDCNDEEINGL